MANTPATHHHPHPNSVSKAETAERHRVATPSHGMGFAFGSATLTHTEFEQWKMGLPANQLAALYNPATTIVIRTSASRPGSESANKALSDRRAQEVVRHLTHLPGFSAHVRIESLGEEPAKLAHRPDARDNASDRVALALIHPGPMPPPPDRDRAQIDVMKYIWRPEDDKNVQQQGRMVKEAAQDFVKGLKGGPQKALVDGLKSLGKKELKWMGQNLAADFKDKPILNHIGASVPYGFRAGLEECADVAPTPFPSPKPYYFSQAYYDQGREMARDVVLQQMSPEQRDNFIAVMHSRERDAFMRNLLEQATADWTRRAGVQTPRGF